LFCLFWLAIAWLGLPPPNDVDDLTFVGPALDLAQGRPMSSHLLTDVCHFVKINPDRWFKFPPVYQELLGSWLYLFGVSRAAMLLFQAAVNIGITAALLSILQKFRIPSGWGVPPLLILFVEEVRFWGWRPEAAGMLLLLWGLVFLLRRDGPGAFAAGVCLIGAGFVLQQAGIYTGLFFLVGLGQILGSREPFQQRWKRATTLLAGALVPVFFFFWGIGWDLPGFLQVYSSTLQSAGGMADSRLNIFWGYWSIATVGWEGAKLLVMAPLLPVVVAGFVKLRRSFEGWLLGALLAGLLANLWIVHTGAYRLSFMYFLLAGAGFCLLGGCTRCGLGWRLTLAVVCPMVLVVLAVPPMGAYFFRLPSNAEEVRQVVSRQKSQAIYFDGNAASSIFGWRLPENARSLRECKQYSFQYIFGKTWIEVPPRRGEIYIIEKADYESIPLRMFGRNWHSTDLNRWQWDVVDFNGDSLLNGRHVGFPTLARQSR